MTDRKPQGLIQRAGGWYADEYRPLQIGSIDGTETRPHDYGIKRAMRAKYDASKDPQIQGDPRCTIIVFALNPTTTEDSLQRAFSVFGEIARIRLVRHKITGESRRYCFIEFSNETYAMDAYQRGDRLTIDDRQVKVDFERERVMKSWVPRRFGGGLGGKKESGQLRFGGRYKPFRHPITKTHSTTATATTTPTSSRPDETSQRSTASSSRIRSSAPTESTRQSSSTASSSRIQSDSGGSRR